MHAIIDISSTIQMIDGHTIPQLGLGTYQDNPNAEITAAVSHALNIGYQHVDTAEMYNNERFVGQSVRQSKVPRQSLFITSKVWPSNFGYDKTIAACQNSLIQLQMDYLDLYLIHWPQGTQFRESWQALIHLQKEGLVRSIGVSNFSVAQIQELADLSGQWPAVNQVEFSPFNHRKELFDFCSSNGIILEAYAPLTRGRKLDHPTLINIAAKYCKSSAQILLRWALQHDIVVIPKSRHRQRIEENAAIFDFEITTKDMATLDHLDEGFRTC